MNVLIWGLPPNSPVVAGAYLGQTPRVRRHPARRGLTTPLGSLRLPAPASTLISEPSADMNRSQGRCPSVQLIRISRQIIVW